MPLINKNDDVSFANVKVECSLAICPLFPPFKPRAGKRFASSAASRVDDEDSIPENFREDRTLNIAKNSPGLKDDPVINELLNNQQNMTTLDNFYNSN